MEFKITAMQQEYAEDISKWKYDGIYSFYDHNEANEESLLDGTHFACLDSRGSLIGYYCYGYEARIPTIETNVYDDSFLDIGLGMKPEFCGKGIGCSFVKFGMEYAQKSYEATRFRLSVAVFNERAIKVYQKLGFIVEQEVTNSFFQNKFYIMIHSC